MLNPIVYSNREPMNVYAPGNVPFEVMGKYTKEEKMADYSREDHEANMDEFIKHIRHHRKKDGKKEFSHGEVKEHMLKHTDKMGMSRAQGSGW